MNTQEALTACIEALDKIAERALAAERNQTMDKHLKHSSPTEKTA